MTSATSAGINVNKTLQYRAAVSALFIYQHISTLKKLTPNHVHMSYQYKMLEAETNKLMSPCYRNGAFCQSE